MNTKKLALAGAAAVAIVGFGATAASAATTPGSSAGRQFSIEKVATPSAHTVQPNEFLACCHVLDLCDS